MFFLHDLWMGRISPIERSVRKGSEFSNLLSESAQLEADFCRGLTNDQKATYEALYDKHIRMMAISEEECFIEGFQMGARVLLDILVNYRPSGMPLINS